MMENDNENKLGIIKKTAAGLGTFQVCNKITTSTVSQINTNISEFKLMHSLQEHLQQQHGMSKSV